MEEGVVIAQGRQRLRRTLPEVLAAETLPVLVGEVGTELRARLVELDRRITDSDHRIAQLAKQDEAARRLMPVEGVGPPHSNRSGGHAWRRAGLSPWAAVRGLGRISPHATLDWRQNGLGTHDQTGQRLAASPLASWGPSGVAVERHTH
jgi:hypothetical protein